MGRLKDAVFEVEEMWNSGLDAPEIAKITGHPLSWVQGVVDDYIIANEEMNRYGGYDDFGDGGP